MESDVIGAGNHWLSADTYSRVQALVPILCVDVLLFPHGQPGKVGLIKRDAGGAQRWCLVGGRVLRGEHLSKAVERHVTATLGAGVRMDSSTLVMRTVAEYFPDPGPGPGDLHDPLKHAVALTYTAACDGNPRATGEASEFRWFRIGDLGCVEFGFGHGPVIAHVLTCAMAGALRMVTRPAVAARERDLCPSDGAATQRGN